MNKKILWGLVALALLYFIWKYFRSRSSGDGGSKTAPEDVPKTPAELLKELEYKLQGGNMSKEAAAAAKLGYN